MVPAWSILPRKVTEGCVLPRPAYFNMIIVCILVQV